MNWRDHLQCVECGGVVDAALACKACGVTFPKAPTGAPILMTAADRDRFHTLLAGEEGTRMQAEYAQRWNFSWIRRFYPPEPVYVNPAAPPLPQPTGGLDLWIGGAGLQLPGFVNIDIAPARGVDIVANASRIPFQDDSCDSVACLALLEHVTEPDRIVAEIHRVLKPDARADVVVPFCHPYHAYPADYSRFSRERLESMFAGFSKCEIGIRTGPTTTMLTFMTYYMKLVFPVHGGNPAIRAFNRVLVGAAGWLMAPFKYLDIWFNRRPDAHVLANHLYVAAKK